MPKYRDELASSHYNLGLLFKDLGKRAEAEEQHREAVAILEKLTAEFPAVPEYRAKLASKRRNLGLLLENLRKLPDAEEQYRLALAIEGKLAAEFLVIPEYRDELALSHNSLAALLAKAQKWSDAEEQYRLALTEQEKLATYFPVMPGPRQKLITQQYIFARFYAIASGNVADKKLEYAGRAMDLLRRVAKTGLITRELVAKDRDLDPLRDRADFKLLIESLPNPNPKETGATSQPFELAPPPRPVNR